MDQLRHQLGMNQWPTEKVVSCLKEIPWPDPVFILFFKKSNLLNCIFFICGDQVARSLGFEDTMSTDIDELL